MKKLIGIFIISMLISCKTTKTITMQTVKFTPEISKIVDELRKIHVFDGKDILDMSRKGYETMAIQLGGKKETIRVIEEFDIPNDAHAIPIRIYRPNGMQIQKSSAIIFLHGGWFVSGSFETHDAMVRQLANATGAAIIFIDYRLAPEYPFPAGLDDAHFASEWIIKNADDLHLDKDKIGIVGDSAGGALAASISTQLGQQFRFQVLIYPAADNSLDTQSWKVYKDGPIINREEGVRAWNWYLNTPKKKTNPLAIPIRIKDFKTTPPTLVLLAEHDPLRDEGLVLAENMKAYGVPIKTLFYKEMTHGFMHMGALLKETKEAIVDIAEFTKEHTQ